MGLIRLIFWTAIFLASTFAFTVLFEHGTSNYVENAQKEWKSLQSLYSAKVQRKQDGSEKLAE